MSENEGEGERETERKLMYGRERGGREKERETETEECQRRGECVRDRKETNLQETALKSVLFNTYLS